MGREPVHLTKEKETLLITLYGKALESRSSDSILRDEAAEEAVRRLDYDFGKLKVRRRDAVGLAIRARELDRWTAEFLADSPGAVVLHLGCGLDTRVFRVDPPASVLWFDIDYPEVIALRRRVYPDREGYRTIGSSVTDPGWLAELPAGRPAMIVAEGLLPYLAEHDARQLLERLTSHFPRGQVAFDAYSRMGARLLSFHPSIKATGASVGGWGIDDPRALQRWVPRLELVTELISYDAASIAKLPWAHRVIYHVARHVPAVMRMGRLLRYRF
ncbi:GlcNAc transferase [Sorangium cellulosum]|uniref:GlcNAc transferase n=1 Tax=Sorangium cellulosum TaxID=56 RepID=A0A2L0F5K9_SORCE|nr:class I SAM-dependent methyltransferase [Sorangium cellulosum]AUX46822.1 GlcNAc transferase [Sorangium cellulosum]